MLRSETCVRRASRVVGAIALFVWGAVIAQEATQARSPAADRDMLEEVVVTAEKRTEDVQNVPIAITVVTAQMLENKGIYDVASLANIAPNVSLDSGTPFRARG